MFKSNFENILICVSNNATTVAQIAKPILLLGYHNLLAVAPVNVTFFTFTA